MAEPAPAPSLADARRVARRYVLAVATGHGARARALARPRGAGEARTLARLGRWLAAVPSGRVRVTGVSAVARSASWRRVTVAVSLEARLGPPPLAPAWVRLGAPTVEVRHRHGAWHVVRLRRDRPLGLRAFGAPLVRTSAAVTVVGPPGAAAAADDIAAVADAQWPDLRRRWAPGVRERALIVLLRGDRDAERVIGSAPEREDSIAWEQGGAVYVVLPRWREAEPIGEAQTIVHELAHLASRRLLARSPVSLWEGVAQVEEDRYLRARGYYMPLAGQPVLSDGARLALWAQRANSWDLGTDKSLRGAYADAAAMTMAIVRAGGVDAVRRLARAFGRSPRHSLTPADVERAFRRALGRGFAEVSADAAALRASHG